MHKRALVTGGAGFIGSHLVPALLERGTAVAIVDDLSMGKKENVHRGAAFYKMDVNDPALASVFEKEKPEVVFHLAFNTNVPLSVREPLFDVRSATGSLNLFLQSVRYGVKKVVMASSSFIYGNVPLPFTEANIPQPISPYAISKIAAEHYLTFFHNTYGLPMTILRYSTVYGPRQTGGALADYIRKISAGERAEMYGDGNLTRDYLYVDDVVRGTLLAAEIPGDHPNPVFNLGTNKEITLNEAYATIARLLKKPENTPLYLEARPGEIRRFRVSYTKAQNELGWQPTVDFEEGVRRVLKSKNFTDLA